MSFSSHDEFKSLYVVRVIQTSYLLVERFILCTATETKYMSKFDIYTWTNSNILPSTKNH